REAPAGTGRRCRPRAPRRWHPLPGHRLQRRLGGGEPVTTVMTVAIIGGGPRGLWAAEELLGLARERGATLDVHVIDDGGPQAYDPAQPGEWLINVRASASRTGLGTFDAWRGTTDR